MQTASQLSQPSLSPTHFSTESQNKQILLHLLSTAKSFNPLSWAIDLQPRSPAPDDIINRTHIASAHRAAVCIYLSRMLLSLYPHVQLSHDLESLVEDIMMPLSFILSDTEMFKAIAWPAFVAGAETRDPKRREWVKGKFHDLWEVQPWGVIRGALKVLEEIWERSKSRKPVLDLEGDIVNNERSGGDWIAELRVTGVDWLII
ncbi:uncharacterized protein KY384_001288 [Bacidia gigantensis]|uniref:uncharacterized protein n=1 Tax=Bacidia gigantensis TaxID=2732470 RepID=UPI001D03760B|nr:uncharacterized protein KY384_001288 [Bacidia gigantensis]KAG8533548.1 hypothetical protein KY384_001288 [Bacidia gigantensis]